MKPFELVIFDCDGVLVDSEIIVNRVFMSILEGLGLTVTMEDMFDEFVGRSMEYCVGLVESKLEQKVPEDFVDNFHRQSEIALKSDLKAVPGIEAALDSIQIPYCVASSGSHEKMRTTLGITSLYSRFEGRLFSVTEVENGKPAPDVFLHAAKSFKRSPGACAVVEDSPFGVAGGFPLIRILIPTIEQIPRLAQTNAFRRNQWSTRIEKGRQTKPKRRKLKQRMTHRITNRNLK